MLSFEDNRVLYISLKTTGISTFYQIRILPIVYFCHFFLPKAHYQFAFPNQWVSYGFFHWKKTGVLDRVVSTDHVHFLSTGTFSTWILQLQLSLGHFQDASLRFLMILKACRTGMEFISFSSALVTIQAYKWFKILDSTFSCAQGLLHYIRLRTVCQWELKPSKHLRYFPFPEFQYGHSNTLSGSFNTYTSWVNTKDPLTVWQCPRKPATLYSWKWI